MMRPGKTTHKGCAQCIINCSNVYVDASGKPITSGLEYETIWAMGAMPGMGVTYAASPMGGDHTAGFVGAGGGSTGQMVNASKSAQIHMAALDSMGLCMFAQSGGMNNLLRAIGAIVGKVFDSKAWRRLGTRILTAEIDFNCRAGLTDKDDRLPAMFHEEPLEPYHETVPYPEDDLHGVFAAIRQTLEEEE